MIPYENDGGLRDYRAPIARRRSRWPLWLLLLVLLALFATLACTVKPPAVPLLVVIVPGPVQHDIGGWADDDTVCILLPGTQALYVPRRCLSMRAIRSLILTARVANDEAP